MDSADPSDKQPSWFCHLLFITYKLSFLYYFFLNKCLCRVFSLLLGLLNEPLDSYIDVDLVLGGD